MGENNTKNTVKEGTTTNKNNNFTQNISSVDKDKVVEEKLLSDEEIKEIENSIKPKLEEDMFSEMEGLTVKRTVYIRRKISNSAFAKANAKVFPQDVSAKIGASISAVNKMLASQPEMEAYLPSIIGVNAKSADWNERLKLYWNSYTKRVSYNGLKLNLNFTYNSHKDLNEYEGKVSNLKKSYYKKVASITNVKKQRELFASYIEQLINLEKTRYKYGRPENISDYLLWRYCLVYNDCAKREQDAYISNRIRFYIQDLEYEKKVTEDTYKVRLEAQKKFIEVISDVEKSKAILKVLNPNMKVEKMANTDIGIALENIYRNKPSAFLKVASDGDLKHRYLLEQLLQAKLFRRLENTSIIVDENNDTVGRNINDAVAYIKSPENEDKVKILIHKLKAQK